MYRIGMNVAGRLDWLTVKQVAPLCGVSRHYLHRHRGTGAAPPHHRRGRKVLYDRNEVALWIDQQRVGLT